MSTLTLSDINIVIDGEPRIQDLRLAQALGFRSPYDIRQLIFRHMKTLENFGTVFLGTMPKKPETKDRGRPGREYWLNEKQALFLCTKSDARNAIEITIEMVEVFYAVRHGGQPALPRPKKLTLKQRREVQKLIESRFTKADRYSVYDLIKDHFEVPRYRDVPRARFEELLDLVRKAPAPASEEQPMDFDIVFRDVLLVSVEIGRMGFEERRGAMKAAVMIGMAANSREMANIILDRFAREYCREKPDHLCGLLSR